jgi:16S rRNA (cytidine1402-2'-O)-methyltransferase
LYVVATPIGNLADLTLRAIHVLGQVDAVACEDTRVSAGLLRHLAIEVPLIALHEHNERSAAALVLGRLAAGERVAYLSDAGTPAVSDPGAALVAAVQAAGVPVVAVPGVSSVAAAISVAGDAAGAGFVFVGFAPPKAGERSTLWREIAAQPARSVVLFEAPHRIAALAAELAQALPERQLTLCRELTKQFETVHRLDAAALPAWLAADTNRTRGEFVLVIHAGAARAEEDDGNTLRVLDLLLAELPLKQAVGLAAAITGTKRNALYDAALARRAGDQPRG